MPYETFFPGQEPGEKIIMVLRRHPFVFLVKAIVYILALGLPILINNFLKSIGLEFTESLVASLGLIASLYYVLIITLFYRAWLDHYLDMWVVTSERIVDIEQVGLFSRNISSQKLYRIQDVSADVKGIIPTFLHYGSVMIQTAGAKSNFEFKQIPNPYEVTKKLMNLVNWKKEVVENEK